CQACLDKRREIDRLKAEIQSLRVQLSKQKRKDKAGFFGSSTPSSKLLLKPIQKMRPLLRAEEQNRAIKAAAGRNTH
ncbi:MAG TPA: hypothetical protein VNN73_01755, partial [Blastocatellia bacterium]|nr:hypothetical protein [Blastocatellia bacterium]